MMAFFKTTPGIIALGFLVFGGYFLITEHAAHTIAWLPWLIILVCPLMHLFMHGGHGGHDQHKEQDNDAPPVLSGNKKQNTSKKASVPRVGKLDRGDDHE